MENESDWVNCKIPNIFASMSLLFCFLMIFSYIKNNSFFSREYINTLKFQLFISCFLQSVWRLVWCFSEAKVASDFNWDKIVTNTFFFHLIYIPLLIIIFKVKCLQDPTYMEDRTGLKILVNLSIWVFMALYGVFSFFGCKDSDNYFAELGLALFFMLFLLNISGTIILMYKAKTIFDDSTIEVENPIKQQKLDFLSVFIQFLLLIFSPTFVDFLEKRRYTDIVFLQKWLTALAGFLFCIIYTFSLQKKIYLFGLFCCEDFEESMMADEFFLESSIITSKENRQMIWTFSESFGEEEEEDSNRKISYLS